MVVVEVELDAHGADEYTHTRTPSNTGCLSTPLARATRSDRPGKVEQAQVDRLLRTTRGEMQPGKQKSER